MNKQCGIMKIILLLGAGVGIKILMDMVNNMRFNNAELNYLVANDDFSSFKVTNSSSRDEVKNVISRVYKNILKSSVNSSTLNLWTNKLLAKQSTLYDFLVSFITPKINLLNTTTLAQSLYLSVLNRQATINEYSKLVSVFNEELRQYGSKERALKKMLTYFVKMSSVVSYCNKLGIKAI